MNMSHQQAQYAPVGFHRPSATHRPNQQSSVQSNDQQASKRPATPSSLDQQHLSSDDPYPQKKRRLNSHSDIATATLSRALARASDVHRYGPKVSSDWASGTAPEKIPRFIDPRLLSQHAVLLPEPEFRWNDGYLFSPRDFDEPELIPVTPTTLRAPRQQTTQYEAATVIPAPQVLPLKQKIAQKAQPVSDEGSVSSQAPAQTSRPTAPRKRKFRAASLSSDEGSVYSEETTTSANLPTPASNSPDKKKKKNINPPSLPQPGQQQPTSTRNAPPPPPPNTTYRAGTTPLPSSISLLRTRIKRATRRNGYPQRTSLRPMQEFDSRYGYLKRSSVLYKDWYGDTRLFTEKWWKFLSMTGSDGRAMVGESDEPEWDEEE